MSVEKFRSLEDARRALWAREDDPDLWRRIRSLWALSSKLAPPCMPRGVFKFKTIEEANAHRDHCVAERVLALRGRWEDSAKP